MGKHIPCVAPLSSFRPAQSQSRLFVAPEDVSEAGRGPACGEGARGARAEGAGLVPSKTKLHSSRFQSEIGDDLMIDLHPDACADRRVNRLRRAVWASGHCHGFAENGFRPAVPWFVTLTYAVADDWKPNHMKAAVMGFRNWCRGRGVLCRYTWVAEIQTHRLLQTGEAAVHYHLLAWLPVGVQMPKWDRGILLRSGVQRAPFWSHGMTQTEVARSGVGYLMKYLSKLGELSRFPKGLRLYGIGGLNAQGRSVRAWFNLPQWVKNSYGVGDVCRMASGFVVRSTGEILEAAYSVRLVPGALLLRALRQLPERWHDGAYSSVSFA